MKATDFEFRFRFFILGLIFWAGYVFGLQVSGPMTTAQHVAEWLRLPVTPSIQAIFALGTLVTTAAALLRTWATAYLHGRIVHDMSLHSDHLVANGPFRYLRNPLYLGTTLLAFGYGILYPPAGFLFISAGALIFNLRLIGREEEGLSRGSDSVEYIAYCRAVPRLLPALTPRLPEGPGKPSWTQAFFTESFFWAFAIAQASLALTLRQNVFFVILFGSLAAYTVAHLWNSRRLARRS